MKEYIFKNISIIYIWFLTISWLFYCSLLVYLYSQELNIDVIMNSSMQNITYLSLYVAFHTMTLLYLIKKSIETITVDKKKMKEYIFKKFSIIYIWFLTILWFFYGSFMFYLISKELTIDIIINSSMQNIMYLFLYAAFHAIPLLFFIKKSIETITVDKKKKLLA